MSNMVYANYAGGPGAKQLMDPNRNFFYCKFLEMIKITGTEGDLVELSDYPHSPFFKWDPVKGRWTPMGGDFRAARQLSFNPVTGTTSPTEVFSLPIYPELCRNGAILEVKSTIEFNNDASGKALSLQLGGTEFALAGGAGIVGMQAINEIIINSLTSQIAYPSMTASVGATSTAFKPSSSIDLTTVQDLKFIVTLADALDTVTFRKVEVTYKH